MELAPEVKDILCCPVCRGGVEEAESGSLLVCQSCGESFGSSGGVPEMFRQADLHDEEFQKYREAYEEHAKEDLFSVPSDATQWSCMKMLARYMGECGKSLILDVGSADAKLGDVISGQVVCLDISLTYLKAAKEKGMAAVAGKAENMPFKRVFDIVVLSNILEHVPDPESVIEQVEHVLKPEGLLYIVVPYKEDLFWQEGENFLDPHLTRFDFARIKALLGNFRITRKKLILFTDSRPAYSVKSFLRRSLNPDMFRRVHEAKEVFGKPGEIKKFSEWRHTLNYLPNALVVPFLRPYSILIESRYVHN